MTPTKHTAWDAALSVIQSLRAHGYAALLAGGCVRDRLLGQTPKDYDVATDATPEQLLVLFPRARQVGAKFGVMLVRKFRHDVEVATFRRDGVYSDGRHPDSVSFGTQEQDAGRRDFTINGMFYDPMDDRLIDHVGGRADLDAGIIRTIGDPAERFGEDHLRMLRAVRFTARFGFALESNTMEAIKRLAPHLAQISAERIWMELDLMLRDASRSVAWTLLCETGLRIHLSKLWIPSADDDRVRQRLAALPPRSIDAELALAATLCDQPVKDLAKIGRDLKLSNGLIRALVWHAESLPRAHQEADLDMAALKLMMANPQWPNLLDLLAADVVARGEDSGPLRRLATRAAAIPAAGIAPPPIVTGDDLCSSGMRPGRRMGQILEALYRAQLNEEVQTRDDAWALVRRLADEP